MNELSNLVTVEGNYNNILTELTSNTSVVNMIEGLTVTKEADKQNWASGNLTYTITINNSAESSYTGVKVSDIIDTQLVDFIDGTVTINDSSATSSEYSYDSSSHTLTINLGDISPSTSSKITFQVKKKV